MTREIAALSHTPSALRSVIGSMLAAISAEDVAAALQDLLELGAKHPLHTWLLGAKCCSAVFAQLVGSHVGTARLFADDALPPVNLSRRPLDRRLGTTGGTYDGEGHAPRRNVLYSS